MWQSLRHWFTPHHTNNHRAKALHIDSLSVYATIFALFYIVTSFFQHQVPQVLGYATDIYSDQLFSATNAKRAEAGLSPLSMNQQLSQAAAAKAQDMFANNYWAHNSPAGKTPWDFIVGSGYKYSVAGENLAKNFSSSSAVVDAWMASPSHRDNLLKSSYREVGFAVVNGNLNGEETTLVVQMFGTPLNNTSQIAQPVKAAEPIPTVAVLAMVKPTNTPIPTPTPTTKPVEVPPATAQTVSTDAPSHPGTGDNQPLPFEGVSSKPIINLSSLNKFFVLGFMTVLFVIFVLDAFLVYKRKVVRVAGHNIAHALFFAALFIAMSVVSRGNIL